jgi:hypothetical protein
LRIGCWSAAQLFVFIIILIFIIPGNESGAERSEPSGTNRAERDSLHELCSLKGMRGGAWQIAYIDDVARRERMEMRGKQPSNGSPKGRAGEREQPRNPGERLAGIRNQESGVRRGDVSSP